MAITDTGIYGLSLCDKRGTAMNLVYNLWHTQHSCFFTLDIGNGK